MAKDGGRMRLGIDVDITLVETGYEWWEWCVACLMKVDPIFSEIPTVKSMYSDLDKMGKCNYNFKEEFLKFKETTNLDIFSFWSKSDLYDNLKPLPNSVEVIRKLVEAGHEIVFISHSKKGHLSSKVKWLKKWFPEANIGGKGGFLATKEKHFADVDIMVDDRIVNLLSFKPSVIKVYFGSIYEDTPFNKHEVDFITSDDCDKGWFELENYFEELEII